MATATPQAPAILEIVDRAAQYRCECGHVLRVFGLGRHRVYFEPADARLHDPVMNHVCPECGRELRGQNAAPSEGTAHDPRFVP